jgi:hypothetical protein
MPELLLPRMLLRAQPKRTVRNCAGHRAWVRRHACSVRGCNLSPIECAHVRCGTDGGAGLKPSDRWVISLCTQHHREQHNLGEKRFGDKYSIDLVELATEFARRSPFSWKLT